METSLEEMNPDGPQEDEWRAVWTTSGGWALGNQWGEFVRVDDGHECAEDHDCPIRYFPTKAAAERWILALAVLAHAAEHHDEGWGDFYDHHTDEELLAAMGDAQTAWDAIINVWTPIHEALCVAERAQRQPTAYEQLKALGLLD